jgi:hypothetical protein
MNQYPILDPDRLVMNRHRRAPAGAIETPVLREGMVVLDPPGFEAQAAAFRSGVAREASTQSPPLAALAHGSGAMRASRYGILRAASMWITRRFRGQQYET